MSRWTVALSLALLLPACGSRAALSVLGDEPHPSHAPAGHVHFPSIAETAAVAEPGTGPGSRPRDNGFGPVPRECELAVPSLDSVLSNIQADVLAHPAGDRPFLRYVSAGFSYPTWCIEDTPVNVVADAMPLLLNSLSLTRSAATAEPLAGNAAALLRIDLREMGWERPLQIGEQHYSNGWEALSANATEAVSLRGPEADALWQELGTRTPLLQAHDLMHAALAAGVYYALLDAPPTLAQLRAALGIPPQLESAPNAYWRAITTQSRISRQDRVVLRYRGAVDAPLFWHTLDWLPHAASGSAFADPLARAADESAILYTLPNGMPAYFLAAADGSRLDESSVLLDASEDDFVPHTAPSCMRCHADGGVIPVVDELRAYAATDPNRRFNGRELGVLAEVYPSQQDLDTLFEADRRRVEAAQARLGVPTPSNGSPLVELLSAYTRDLEPVTAAAELFVSRAELERRRGELPGPLRVVLSVGSIGRPSFNESYGAALCALSSTSRNQPVDCP